MLSAGSHNFTATFTDDNDATVEFVSTTGTLNGYVVGAASTQILGVNFTSSAPIAGVGATVTFTAQVTTQLPSVAAINAGTITFRDTTAGTILGTITVSSSGAAIGTASVSTTFSTTGLHTIAAQYDGSSPQFAPSAAASLSETVHKASTVNVNAIASPTPSFSQTLNYQVSVSGAGAPAPTGNVTITETVGSTTTWGPFAYGGGTVSMPVTGLGAGSHTLVFSYDGDANFAGNTTTITQTVLAAATTTVLANLAPVLYGQSVTLTATVNSTTAANPNAGSVTFNDTYLGVTTPLGTIPLTGNSAQLTTAATQLKGGGHSISATYNNTGNTNYANSTTANSQTQTVNAASTLTVLSPLTPSVFGNVVTFTATVTATSAGSPGNPTAGTVTFTRTLGATTVTMGPVPVNGSGVATFTTAATDLAVGSYLIKAVYNGSSPNYGISPISTTLTQVVNPAGTTVAITPSAPSGTVFFGNTVTFTALVSVTTGGAPGGPGGTVSFWDGPANTGTLLKANVALTAVNSTSAQAVFTTTATQLSAVSHTITAVYSGSANYLGFTQAAIYVVKAATTKTTLTSTPTTWAVGQTLTFTATVASTSGGTTGFPTGTVTYVVDGTNQTPIILASGKAIFTTKFTVPGLHSVSAFYTPAAGSNFATSAATTQTQSVLKPAAVSMTSLANTAGVTITATVTTTATGGPPTGTVKLYEGTTLLGTITLSGGKGKIVLNLASGNHQITAVYSGDSQFNPATKTQSIAGKAGGRVV